ncbi:capsule biosynthesis protein [Sulfitobacter sp. M57]|uniref:capsule biosynthesis protein n=1 Tax=unclassified Sulfitobacter TaxID=196795 RepID=UPI0023E2F80A|nr:MULTISPECIES: capsule biosynthesis protein [unclassified Sulfitobacter]MDF3415748.1 capsule biosynthesis protein [Sulfitobacter sp. KE5]MDF3423228.1 capsule biosynthesis protein [Sulfitobacter sp. KE43]MDF3434294.1 capsule biosynthesis protein [Sulfitobacter sp. KE42]MDF3459673.1 capsule biosynthesis protein [Sulfitobacter sp. S74]MDF3463832.1 capsule biosynthesis protein [Sulfitobacter sp. Ks18]
MTTKPKARKFRIKRNTPTSDTPTDTAAPAAPDTMPEPIAARAAQARPPAGGPTPTPAKDATPSPADAPPGRAGAVSSAAEVAGETDIDAIRREGLTGRQLRMARRVAQKHDLAPISDFDAVRLLRAKGIDPFERSNMLELVVPQGNGADGAQQLGRIETTRTQLPQTVPADGTSLPSTEISPAERRAREISDIQREITNRRRRKLGLLLVRLAFFVMLPTIAAGYYFYNVATPMYATNSQFLIIQSEGGGGASPFGSILPTQFANSADSIATQAYLQSKDAMLRLDRDVGFKDHFSDETIDPIQRLEPDATNEETYKTYKKNVKIGYDPTEGVIRLEVIAGDPNISASFSESLIKYAEERVNNLSKQKREDGMRDALAGFDIAQKKRRDAQEALIRMQVENGVDPQAEIVAIRTQITTYEGMLIEKELELAALLDNARPNRAKVDGARGDVRRLQVQLEKLKEKMNSSTTGENSLAEQSVRLQLAQTDLAAADMVLQSAQTALDQARTEAGRQVRYLTVAVEPVAPQEPTYPRKFENTILAFLIFAGIYLMLSLTASILREQVTS